MKLVVTYYDALCETKTFKINGKDADDSDFGEKFDRDQDGAEDYCCGDMQFTRIPYTPSVLKKYGITKKEYDKVCDELENGLSWGSCGWCS